MERSTPAMRRNGGMGWRETRKELTSFRSLLALSLFSSRFPLSHLLLRISLVSTPFPLHLASLSLCSSLLPRLFFSPFFSFEARLEPTLACAVSLSCVLLGSPPFIIHRQGKFIYVLQLILNSQFTIPWLSPSFPSFF